MADGTKIEWTEATWNPITGCSIVSPGCTHCYAMKLAGTRLAHIPSRAGLTQCSKSGPVWTGEVRFNEGWLLQPLQWKRPRTIFVCAHGDLFHESVPDEWIDRVFAVMALAPQHTLQVLTKRAKRMREYFDGGRDRADIVGLAMLAIVDRIPHGHRRVPWPLPNVWLGVSTERQQEADERIPHLLATPAAVRWVSAEPLLGPIDLAAFAETSGLNTTLGLSNPGLDWVVAGGESGDRARPMSIHWARELRDQCAAARIPFFFKQWGSWKPAGVRPSETPGHFAFGDYEHDRECMIAVDHYPRQFTKFGARTVMELVGKKAAGRLLDGIEHNAMPQVRSA